MTKWGKQISKKKTTLRGEYREPGKHAVDLTITGGPDMFGKMRYAFEVHGPGLLSAKSLYVFFDQEKAKEAAEVMAMAIFSLGEAFKL